MLTTLSRDLTNWVDQQNTGFKPRCIRASFDIVYQLIFFSTLGDTLCRCFMIAWLAALKLQPPVSALMLHVRSKKYRKHFFLSWWQGLGYLIPFTCTVRSLTFSWWLQPCQQWSDQLVYIYRLFMLRTVYSLSDLNPEYWPNWWLISSFPHIILLAAMQTNQDIIKTSPFSPIW